MEEIEFDFSFNPILSKDWKKVSYIGVDDFLKYCYNYNNERENNDNIINDSILRELEKEFEGYTFIKFKSDMVAIFKDGYLINSVKLKLNATNCVEDQIRLAMITILDEK